MIATDNFFAVPDVDDMGPALRSTPGDFSPHPGDASLFFGGRGTEEVVMPDMSGLSLK